MVEKLLSMSFLARSIFVGKFLANHNETCKNRATGSFPLVLRHSYSHLEEIKGREIGLGVKPNME